jgi:nitrite reductase/ring-hydroxylating ferredoxin subunit
VELRGALHHLSRPRGRRFKRVAPVEAVRSPWFSTVRIRGRFVLLTRLEDGTPVAFSRICPHHRLPMDEGALREGVLVCPNHQYSYEPSTGENVFPSQVTPLQSAAGILGIVVYEVREENGWVWVGPRLRTGVRTLEDPADGCVR